jgi:HAD superfamily hydrolase (TIGR01509 family)
VLSDVGLTLTERDYYDKYLGFDDVGAFRAIAADRGRTLSRESLAEMTAKKAVRLEALERDTSVLFPGAASAIEAAAAAVPIGIASGAIGPEIRRVLDHEGLTRHFSVIVAAEDTPASKPSPDPYLRAVALLAQVVGEPTLHAGECVAIEDSRWGLESARAAGLRTVAVTNSYDAADLAMADLVMPSLAQFDVDRLRRLLS